MEITCKRCHRTVSEEDCFCPACGLPRLVYEGEGLSGETAPEEWPGADQDAASIDWRHAIPLTMVMGIPAGILSSGVSPLGFLGLLWTAMAAAWTVFLYARTRRPAWITLGAGVRMGLVTGLLAGWMAFSLSGGALYVQRVALHQGSQIDAEWKNRVEASQKLTQNWTNGMGTDANQAQTIRAQVKAWMLSPEGHAGIEAFGFACNAAFLLLFSIAGGALGARLLLRSRRQQV
jgi:RNA polymerase subunit RPABC4/transcription elongation factor Spt4